MASQLLVEEGLLFWGFYENMLAPSRFSYHESIKDEVVRLKSRYGLGFWRWNLLYGFQFMYVKSKYIN